MLLEESKPVVLKLTIHFYLHTTLPYPRITLDISFNQLIFLNLIFKGKAEDNANKSTLRGTEVRKGHGPTDKAILLGAREGRCAKAGWQGRRAGGQAWLGPGAGKQEVPEMPRARQQRHGEDGEPGSGWEAVPSRPGEGAERGWG